MKKKFILRVVLIATLILILIGIYRILPRERKQIPDKVVDTNVEQMRGVSISSEEVTPE